MFRHKPLIRRGGQEDAAAQGAQNSLHRITGGSLAVGGGNDRAAAIGGAQRHPPGTAVEEVGLCRLGELAVHKMPAALVHPQQLGNGQPPHPADDHHVQPAVGGGGLARSGKEHAVVVSMGTGTSFLWANKGGEIRHLIGSGVGGGTLAGLSSLTTGVHQYALIRKLCQDGDLSHIDLTMADLSREQVGNLPPEATAANFAKVADDATPSDKMLGIVNLVLQSIGTMSVLACKCCGTDTVVLTGALTMLPPARETFELFKQLYHVNFIIPENATFATAIGAALYSVREN